VATYVDVIDAAREETDQVGSNQGGDDAAFIAFLQREYPKLRRRLSKVAPDWFTIQAEGTLTSDPINSVDKWSQVRRVQFQAGDRWVTVPPADPNFLGDPARICYRVIGGNLEILPETLSLEVLTFRVEYIPDHALPGADSDLDLPPGAEELLVQLLARRIRRKLDQSETPHIARYKEVWDETVSSLKPEITTPTAVSDYNGDFDGGW
jgi:hypothetical protein